MNRIESILVVIAADPSQQSNPMKTISLSALVLISFPFSVFAQGIDLGAEKSDNYFLTAPQQSLTASNYSKPYQPIRKRSIQQSIPVVAEITPAIEYAAPAVEQLTERPVAKPQIQSTFKPPAVASIEIEAPQVSALDYVIAEDSLIPNVNDDAASFVQQTSRMKEISGGDFNPKSKARFASQEIVEEIVEADMVQPAISPQDFPLPNEIVKPSPQNTVQIPEPTGTVIESIPPMPVSDDELNEYYEGEAPAKFDSASIDDIRMSQRSNSWDEKPNMMRDVGDHFSPGGEPFAYRGIAGDANFFGVDRKSCCDEWAGICNCSGGLKANPGHWGNPYLRSKDNCDTAKRVFGNHRGRKNANSCECQSCSGN